MVEQKIVFGREAGPSLPCRLFSAATTLDRAVSRDNRIAAALEAAEAREAEKRAELDATRDAP
jgi:hypothetical protein